VHHKLEERLDEYLITLVLAPLTLFIISALPKRRTPHLPRKLKPTDASVRAKGPSYVQYDRGIPNLRHAE
jgi:hypothetical protein